MAMIAYLQRLFAYDDWANREVLASLRGLKDPPARSIKILAHILSAERLWLERLRLQKQPYPVWPEFNLEHCELEIANLQSFWQDYLKLIGEDGLSRTLTYKNTKGENWTNAKQDILMHVIMHSAYHRGQIAADMRAAGHTPAYTDFIHGVRQGLVE
jgi:uncharacterized damage-inducible protein DinB